MNRILWMNLLFVLFFAGVSCTSPEETEYNEALAIELGADEYGMKPYIMALLKSGPTQEMDAEAVREIQAGHMAHIRKMSEEGVLILAGPFMQRGEIRGIFLFNLSDLEEAERWTKADPAVQSGRLVMELHPWYGSAAIVKIPEIHKQITRTSI